MSKQPGVVLLADSDEYLSRTLRYPLITNELNSLLGKVLTLIDASISDKKQNKAIKDIIRNEFSSKMHGTFWDYCYRKEFQYDFDGYLKQNIVEGTARHSDEIVGVPVQGFSGPIPLDDDQ